MTDPWRTPDRVPLPMTRVAVCWEGMILTGEYWGKTFNPERGECIAWSAIDCWAFPCELLPEEFRDYPGPATTDYQLTT